MHKLLLILMLIVSNLCFGEDTIVDIFKPLSLDYLYQTYDLHPEKQNELNEMFRVQKVINKDKHKNKKIMSYTLFWKAAHSNWAQPTVTKDSIHEIVKFSRKTCSFYDNYVLPMIKSIKRSSKSYPDWVFRIYLANDLQFLVDHLKKETDAEIYIMSSSSIAHSPGAMWRFLAFDDPDAVCVCVKDSDDDFDLYQEMQIVSFLNDPSTDGWYRILSLLQRGNTQEALYSPIFASGFGAKNIHNIKMEKAMKGFILHRQLYPNEPRHPRDRSYDGHPYGFGNEFPNYGFDERFLKHVIYFDAVQKGLLTTISFYSNNNAKDILNAPKDDMLYLDLAFVSLYNINPIYQMSLKMRNLRGCSE